ncbi:deaminase domain-containing protein [uncultured Tenacibaculum sp.]|uniref:deaminase domain-containing protein n=1 Tax=uncultured Tenacibaculum sp. TaxID=174713 RepID=UPI002622548C|nr:deaminase domain-containing protein [uncultured Tenacibaculum sp.]
MLTDNNLNYNVVSSTSETLAPAGEIKLVSELPYCMSCQGVIQDFSTMFPNVKVILIDGLKY